MSINSFTFDGVSSEDMGLYVGGQKTFGAPQRDVTKVSIPGRNGDLVRDNGRFLNSEIAYNIVAMNDFKETAQNVRNWLMSAKGYKRLEDTYHPEHYRMARVSGGIDFETGAYNATGKAQILFDCMPQRFRKSGEEISDASMVNHTESGDLLSFEAVAESPITSASVSLSPIQSLNGYDSPWPGGGWKNKLPLPATQTVNGITFTANSDGTVTANGTASNTADYYFCGGNGLYEQLNISSGLYYLSGSPSGGGTCVIFIVKEGGQILAQQHDNAQESVTLDATAKYRIFARVFNGVTVNNVTLKPMLRASGTDETFSPYSNICPISGHTGAELIRTGNPQVWDEEWDVGSINDSTGQNQSGENVRSKNYIPIVPNMSYYFYVGNGSAMRLFFYDADKNFLNYINTGSVSFTAPENAYYCRFRSFNVYGGTYLSDISINYPSTDHDYHAYDGDTYSVTFTDQGTVYGGTYDFVSGKLRVTWASLTLNGTDRWSGTPNSGWYTQVNSLVKLPSASEYADAMLSDRFPVGIVTNGYLFGYVDPQNEYPGKNWIYYMNTDFTKSSQVSAYFADNPTQVVYKLATPLEYTLSPQQLTTLLGANSVFGSGPITLTFVEPSVIENPTPFESKPIIRVYGSGTCTVTINNQIITINNVTDFVDIDCETMNCYNGVVNKNADVVLGAQGFPVLPAGKTMIKTGGGTTKIEITPRWWEV